MPLLGPYKTQADALAACGSASSKSSSSSTSKSKSASASASASASTGPPTPPSCTCLTTTTWSLNVGSIGGGTPTGWTDGCGPITNNDTQTCAMIGNVTLVQTDTCHWIFFVAFCDHDETFRWMLDFNATAVQYELTMRTDGNFTDGLWVLSGQLNCTGCNTFNLVTAPGFCSSWPSSITVCPSMGMGMAAAPLSTPETTAEKKPCNCGNKQRKIGKDRPTR